MDLAITPLHPLFVGDVGGNDPRNPIADWVAEAIVRTCDRHAVPVFRDRPPGDRHQLAFSARPGPL